MRSRATASVAARADAEGTSSNPRGEEAMTTTTTTLPQGGPQRFALPGRTTRKRNLEFRTARRRKNDLPSASGGTGTSSGLSLCASAAPLVLAVMLWYSLGVVSISSSKVLLTPYSSGGGSDDYETDYEHEYDDSVAEEQAFYRHVGGLPPLFLTLQQLLLGSTFLRLAIYLRFLGLTKGIAPLDDVLDAYGSGSHGNRDSPVLSKLVWTGIYFALGFLTTNMAFGAAAPTYVETLKAAEPITSAVFAVLWGIERLTLPEVVGLFGIVGGVLLSTNGSNHSASMSGESAGTSLAAATAIVMASNFCFSLRGLYQKLFRTGAKALAAETERLDAGDAEASGEEPSKPARSVLALDDLNLQFRMQQTGVVLLLVPTLLWHGEGLFLHATGAASHLATHDFLDLLRRYMLWSVGNGLAFSSYNLASTYLLTRISVVHHAALNCTRRIFAIVCTGLLFRIPISAQSMTGIGISFAGFMVFSWAKSRKKAAEGRTGDRQTGSQRADAHREIPSGNAAGSNNNNNNNNISASSMNGNNHPHYGGGDRLTHRKKSGKESAGVTLSSLPAPPGEAQASVSERTPPRFARPTGRPKPRSAAPQASVRFPPPPPPPPPPIGR